MCYVYFLNVISCEQSRLQDDLVVADSLFYNNGMIANAGKFQAMVLGSSNYCFEFIVNNFSIPIYNNRSLLGLNIDRKFIFSEHIRKICNTVSNQIAVLSRFRKILS